MPKLAAKVLSYQPAGLFLSNRCSCVMLLVADTVNLVEHAAASWCSIRACIAA